MRTLPYIILGVLCATMGVDSESEFEKDGVVDSFGVAEGRTKQWGVKGETFVSMYMPLSRSDHGFLESARLAASYARHEGAHCIYSWKNGPSEYDTKNGTLTTVCFQGCKNRLQQFNDINNGRVPQTGIYVRAKSNTCKNFSSKICDYDDFVADLPSKVICSNEFGCHANDQHLITNPPVGPKASTRSYKRDVNHTVHDGDIGVKLATPPEQPNGAAPSVVRKAVCKCNNGFTSPLQLQSSWCGQECPGPDCALRTKDMGMNEEWCDDLVDGSKRAKRRCKEILKDQTKYSKTGYVDMNDKKYMENFYAEQGEIRHMNKDRAGYTKDTFHFGDDRYWEHVVNKDISVRCWFEEQQYLLQQYLFLPFTRS